MSDGCITMAQRNEANCPLAKLGGLITTIGVGATLETAV